MGAHHDAVTLCAAISGCEKRGHTEQTMILLHQMRDIGIIANVISYSAAISACE